MTAWISGLPGLKSETWGTQNSRKYYRTIRSQYWLRDGDNGASALDIVPEGVGQFRAEFVCHAAGGALHLFHEAVQVVSGAGDGYHADGSRLPRNRLVHLSHGEIEALLQLVLERADHLPP